MSVNLRNARALCTAAEFDLVAASGGDGLKALNEARLKSKIVRARTLRDKYRDLLRRQRLAARRNQNAKADRDDANARTEKKAELFEQILARFVARLEKLQAAAARPARRTAARVPAVKSPAAERPAARKAASSVGGTVSAVPTSARSPKAPALTTPLAPRVRQAAVRGFVSDKAAQSARNVKLKSTTARNVQAHVSARGRRNQAKRDSRPK